MKIGGVGDESTADATDPRLLEGLDQRGERRGVVAVMETRGEREIATSIDPEITVENSRAGGRFAGITRSAEAVARVDAIEGERGGEQLGIRRRLKQFVSIVLEQDPAGIERFDPNTPESFAESVLGDVSVDRGGEGIDGVAVGLIRSGKDRGGENPRNDGQRQSHGIVDRSVMGVGRWNRGNVSGQLFFGLFIWVGFIRNSGEMSSSALRLWSVRVGLAFVFWTMIGLSFASQFYLSSLKSGRPISWGQAVTWSLGDWYVWAVLSVPIIQLARRFRFDDLRWIRSVGIHLGASMLVALGYMVLRSWLGQAQSWISGEPVSFAEAFNRLAVKAVHFNLLIYWVIVSATHAFAYYRQYQERALRASELEKRLAQAKLQALQMQLNPHFLFNTLNAIASLMHKDVKAADRMITRLADLLRYALESTDAHEVTLRQELSFLERYLEIEKTRFGSRLTVRIEIPDQALDALVPNLILQPLVENAIKHGIERRSKPGLIELRAGCEDNRLRLTLTDNGPGLPTQPGGRKGIGLANTRARLAELYGAAHTFELRDAEGGGVMVEVTLPLRLAQLR
jgi:two-component system, LytTR family, sensor kinase